MESGTKLRKVNVWSVYQIAIRPLTELHGTEHDPWTYVEGKHVFTSNPTWEAAVAEAARRIALYDALVPVRDWGITKEEALRYDR